jgi:hypothetical protein
MVLQEVADGRAMSLGDIDCGHLQRNIFPPVAGAGSAQSIVMPADLMGTAHFAISLVTNWRR